MDTPSAFSVAAMDLVESYPEFIRFPLCGVLPIPTDVERSVLAAAQAAMPVSPNVVADLRTKTQNKGIRHAYIFGSFAVRTAILAVRTRESTLFKVSALFLVIDHDALDWRDVLKALVLIDACTKRMQFDIERAFDPAIELATERRQTLIRSGYFARTPEWRLVESFGFTAVGEGTAFTFESIPVA